MKWLALVVVSLTFSAAPGVAGTTANVNGYVRDNTSRRAIANARITFISGAATYDTNSDALGFYSFVGVTPGTYRVTALAYNAFLGDWQLPRPVFVSVGADQNERVDLLLQWHTELEAFRPTNLLVEARVTPDHYRITPRLDPFYGVNEGQDIRFVPGIQQATFTPPTN